MAGKAALRAALLLTTPDPARTARARLRARLLVARHRRVIVAALIALATTAALDAVRPPGQSLRPVLVAARDLPAGHRLAPADLVERPWASGALPDGLLAHPSGHTLAAPLRRGEPVTDARVGASPAAGQHPAPGGASGPAVPSGLVVVTVRLSDPASALVAVPGGRVDVVAGGPADPLPAVPAPAGRVGAGAAVVAARDALVLAVPAASTVADGAADDPAPRSGASPSGGGGLLGVLSGGGDSSGARSVAADAPVSGLRPPAGVVLVAVAPGDALRLASIAGVRTLSLARRAGGAG